MSWLIYGANGYTGELCAREAARRGEAPILAGRNTASVRALAEELGFAHRSFGLDDPRALRSGLNGVDAVLHCAGPFVRTSTPMVDACLATGTHYLDITGEIAVFEAVFRRHDEAVEASVVLLPGVGFDVVPTDCLAARLAAAISDPTHLELAFHSAGGSISRGTLKTMVEALPHAGAVREDGRIRPVPAAWDAKKIAFTCGEKWAMTIAWGDVSTAFRSTGIPNIRVYNGTPPKTIRKMQRIRPVLPLAGLKPVKRLAQWWIGRTVTGPGAEVRERARVFLWGRVQNAAGAVATATFDTREGYAFTALSSVEAVVRLLASDFEPGAWTPSTAFGPEFAESLAGTGEMKIALSGARSG